MAKIYLIWAMSALFYFLLCESVLSSRFNGGSSLAYLLIYYCTIGLCYSLVKSKGQVKIKTHVDVIIGLASSAVAYYFCFAFGELGISQLNSTLMVMFPYSIIALLFSLFVLIGWLIPPMLRKASKHILKN